MAVSQLSNALGTVLPVKEIARICRERGATLLVDGAQSVPHMPVNVKDIDCDFLCFSGHKMLGAHGHRSPLDEEGRGDRAAPGRRRHGGGRRRWRVTPSRRATRALKQARPISRQALVLALPWIISTELGVEEIQSHETTAHRKAAGGAAGD